jgi:hypothetical protein
MERNRSAVSVCSAVKIEKRFCAKGESAHLQLTEKLLFTKFQCSESTAG